jgi:hypothetical protein
MKKYLKMIMNKINNWQIVVIKIKYKTTSMKNKNFRNSCNKVLLYVNKLNLKIQSMKALKIKKEAHK